MYQYYVKPSIDFMVALIAIILLSPIFLIVTLGLYFANQGKPFFFQDRPGLKGAIFKIIKFKTMNDRKDMKGDLLSDKQRLTKIGAFVRKTSIDELPQLINVLKGDMSLIGPRPLLPEYLPLYNEMQRRRHELRPGITGWAQVNGRNAISWKEKFKYDIYYVERCSFYLDMKIVYLSFAKVFKSEGINSSDSTTMEAFKGDN